jgi:hypothetical protein
MAPSIDFFVEGKKDDKWISLDQWLNDGTHVSRINGVHRDLFTLLHGYEASGASGIPLTPYLHPIKKADVATLSYPVYEVYTTAYAEGTRPSFYELSLTTALSYPWLQPHQYRAFFKEEWIPEVLAKMDSRDFIGFAEQELEIYGEEQYADSIPRTEIELPAYIRDLQYKKNDSEEKKLVSFTVPHSPDPSFVMFAEMMNSVQESYGYLYKEIRFIYSFGW